MCEIKTRKRGFVDHSGKWVIAAQFGHPNRQPVGIGFENGLAHVEVVMPSGGLKEGYINTKGVFVWSRIVGSIRRR